MLKNYSCLLKRASLVSAGRNHLQFQERQKYNVKTKPRWRFLDEQNCKGFFHSLGSVPFCRLAAFSICCCINFSYLNLQVCQLAIPPTCHFAKPLHCLLAVFTFLSIYHFANGTVRFKNGNNCLYTNIYSYLETSGGISYNPYLNVVHFFNTRVN